MTGYHTRWARPEEVTDDPERIAIREALAFVHLTSGHDLGSVSFQILAA